MFELSLKSQIAAFNIGIVPKKKPDNVLQNRRLLNVEQSPVANEVIVIPVIVMNKLYFRPILSEADAQTIIPNEPSILDRPSCIPTLYAIVFGSFSLLTCSTK